MTYYLFMLFAEKQNGIHSSIKYPNRTRQKTKMARIHCSRCGQEGHNRRNIRCPQNSNRRLLTAFTAPPSTPQTEITPETLVRIRVCKTILFNAIECLVNLTQFISQPLTVSVPDYIVTVMRKISTFCKKINLALASDSVERPLILPVPLFDYFNTQIELFNTRLQNLIGSRFNIETCFQNNKFEWILVNLNELSEKRTSEYFKEISLVHDLTIPDDASTCDCPLCFDAIPATDALVTNCNHSFCVTCVKGFATANKDKTKIPDCPMCRTDITNFKVGNQLVQNEISEHLLNL